MRFARAHRRGNTQGLNKTEGLYAARLAIEQAAGRIIVWQYESVKLCIAKAQADVRKGAWYTPDFLVVAADDVLEFHEVKARKVTKAGSDLTWMDDAKDRVKVVAEKYPWFRFRVAILERDKSWTIEEWS